MLEPRLGLAAILSTLALWGCGGDDGGGSGGSGGSGGKGTGGSGGGGVPVPLDPGAFTYRLEESPPDLPLWTTPATHKIRDVDRPPDSTSSGLSLSAAKNEFEPAQLVVGPAGGEVTVAVEKFPDLGGGQRVKLAVAGYEQGWIERLTPIASGDSVTLDANAGTAVWLTVYVPKNAPAGDHSTTLTVTPSGGSAVGVPVKLHVFDFALPDEIHFATQLNVSLSDLSGGGANVEQAKTMLFEHRFTPKSVTWPSGFRWGITWDSGANPARCRSFYDEPDEGADYAIGELAKKYIHGEGWNGVGFPNAMIFQFVDNSTPRPDTFCGESRGDHFGTAAYNAEWSKFLSALDDYLVAGSYTDKAYYYVQNEPQGPADYDVAAHLCRLTKAAAPDLRIAVSEEPKPEIAEHPDGACGYDIWIAHAPAYEEPYAHERIRDHGETVWYYSLDHDADPYFNPTVIDQQGMHQRIIPWAAWTHRIRGWAYYDFGRFFDGKRPGVRAELFREGFEDYEYLWLANGGAHPKVDEPALIDPTVKSVASSMTSWNKDADALMALRHELGLFIEGSRATIPTLSIDSDKRKRGAYYLNFQDPGGRPKADPLMVDGKTWMKIGWSEWTDENGYGWSGENVGTSIVMYGFDDVSGYDAVEKSYVYDDYGRKNLFEFALENGRYSVTVGAGRPGRGYPGEPHNVVVEGVPFIVDQPTTDAEPTIVVTKEIDLSDGSVSLEMGGRSPVTDDFEYTFLAYVAIEPVG